MKSQEIKHIRGRVRHPQTQGKIERYHRSVKNVIKLDVGREIMKKWISISSSNVTDIGNKSKGLYFIKIIKNGMLLYSNKIIVN